MDFDEAAAEFQRLHTEKSVRRESIIAWYTLYSSKLPRMDPGRSAVDLIRTIALWMELSDRGGSPAFPFDYQADLYFPTIHPTVPAPRSKSWLIGMLCSVVGVLFLFYRFFIGAALILLGQGIEYAAYSYAGGPTNPDSVKEGNRHYERIEKRVLDWVQARRSADVPALADPRLFEGIIEDPNTSSVEQMLYGGDPSAIAAKIYRVIRQTALQSPMTIRFGKSSGFRYCMEMLDSRGFLKPFWVGRRPWIRRLILEEPKAFVCLAHNIALSFTAEGRSWKWRVHGGMAIDDAADTKLRDLMGAWKHADPIPVLIYIELGSNIGQFRGLLEGLRPEPATDATRVAHPRSGFDI